MRERERFFPFSGSLAEQPQWLGLDQTEAEILEWRSGLLRGCRVPSAQAILCCTPRLMSRGLDRKWRSQVLNLCPNEILTYTEAFYPPAIMSRGGEEKGVVCSLEKFFLLIS